ncbi:putative F-box-like domain protein [Rhizoctonia solani 123E]|uniref:Putative F-box-like domain protein n=1 Tax=Rhizoctonia solani 123E TaxID=1423351 RepID=A0A074SVH7_9AGAM|nr:putative F-box-like domain protein [Rhizoctonia solani 123E]
MQASPETHGMGFERWVSVLIIRESQDWKVAFKVSHLIRELVCLDGTILPSESSILAQFPRLRAVCVDSHEDVRAATGVHRFAYRDVFSCLPPTVRHIEIKHAHGPDVNVISCVKRDCPDLESLWLGRCTMFNRVPSCNFWDSFPHEHDSYISSEGTDGYAHSLGVELSPLRNLRSVRLGIYLVPSTTILAHRLFHARNLPVPPVINWQTQLHPPLDPNPNENTQDPQPQPQLAQISDLIALLHQAPEKETCKECWQEFFAGTQSAEISATQILKGILPRLELVEWMNWFSPFHLGIRSCLPVIRVENIHI